MQTFPSFLVGLSLGPDDPALLAHVAALAARMGTERIHLVHVLPDGAEPGFRPSLEHETEELLWRAAKELSPLPCTIDVLCGDVAVRLLQQAVAVDADVLCIGRRGGRRLDGLGASAGSIVRKSPCSVLLVPRDAPVDLGRLLVPVDFSDRSRAALEVGLMLSQAQENGAALAVHAYELPLGWQRSGGDEASWCERAEAAARVAWAEMTAEMTLGEFTRLRVVRDPTSHLGTAPHGPTLLRAIEEERPGMVITSSRGRTVGARLLLGSVAARLVDGGNHPFLVLKTKGETLSILEALRII